MSDTYRSDALSGRRALITGGARGIGEATARLFAAIGADLVIADLDAERAVALAVELSQSGIDARAIGVDLRNRAATLRLGREVGELDILVNNAAPPQTNAAFLEIPDREWDLQFSVIMWAPLILTREIGRSMAEAKGGVIVNISSIAARKPVPFVAPYAAAKSALEIITRVTATELGPRGVRANAVAPTFVPTERNRPLWERMGVSGDEPMDPLGTTPTAKDVANLVAFLCTPASRFLNGEVLYMDRGAAP